jgi:hypothetical protein
MTLERVRRTNGSAAMRSTTCSRCRMSRPPPPPPASAARGTYDAATTSG